jgi:hypothetical protein
MSLNFHKYFVAYSEVRYTRPPTECNSAIFIRYEYSHSAAKRVGPGT